ncbi:radical SAM protein [Thermotoga caldifontis]|uniref:radical SAM protein n=1 Tax=Thermotoga caldifontis TaxID=1508419 RepID=UPI000AFCF16D|nr:radical SAM protein [Thermotoga caldifontis]
MLETIRKRCVLCGFESESIGSSLKVCVRCLRERPIESLEIVRRTRARWRRSIDLPVSPPRGGERCFLCVNECEISQNDTGYCGVIKNVDGRLIFLTDSFDEAYLRYYLDPHPTNCVALPVCPEKDHRGFFNLAVFFAGCNLDCLFCQNIDHKYMIAGGTMRDGERVSVEELVRVAEQNRVSCVCYFGGDPVPWSFFTLKASRKMKKRICWETNGLMNDSIAKQMASISLETGGIIKIDWKAFSPSVYEALTGVDGEKAVDRLKRNVELIAKMDVRKEPPLLVVSTLIVPHYVDEFEVFNISRFLAQIDEKIPYVLLAFAPQHLMHDLPTTSREQMRRVLEAARSSGLKNVFVENVWLLS